MTDWQKCSEVERHPEKLSGAWVFRGTRVPVATLFENIRDGASVEQFLDWFPGVGAARVRGPSLTSRSDRWRRSVRPILRGMPQPPSRRVRRPARAAGGSRLRATLATPLAALVALGSSVRNAPRSTTALQMGWRLPQALHHVAQVHRRAVPGRHRLVAGDEDAGVLEVSNEIVARVWADG